MKLGSDEIGEIGVMKLGSEENFLTKINEIGEIGVR